MPPKRKAAAAKGGPAAKKGKKAVAVAKEEAPETTKDKITKLKAADEGKVKKHKPDSYCHVADSVSSGYKFCKSTDVQVYEFNNSVLWLRVIFGQRLQYHTNIKRKRFQSKALKL